MINFGKPNILIIDDEKETTDLFQKFLQKHGYKTFIAYDGETGLNILQRESVGIIFCDICMPQMDGLEFLCQVREYNITAQVIIITGYSTISRCLQSIEKDVCNYLTKPVRPETILENIRRAERNLEEKYEMMSRGTMIPDKAPINPQEPKPPQS